MHRPGGPHGGRLVFTRVRRPFVLVFASAFMVLSQVLTSAPATASGTSPSNIQSLSYSGSFVPSNQGAGSAPSGASSEEIPPNQPNSKTLRHTAVAGIPTAASNPVVSGELSGFGGFNGISHRDQRIAGTGVYANTQWSLEPPDQGLCVGGGKIVEAVNNALQVYDTQGNALTPAIALSQFFGLAPEVVRTATPVYGDFISDPKCYYDPDTARWFLTELQISLDPSTGAVEAPSHLLLAVSNSPDPTAAWSMYKLDTTDDGTNGTTADAGCPCFGDQPLIGADANGFYVATNEYGITSSGYNGAQVYAFSKLGLENGTNVKAVHISAGPMTQSMGGLAYSIQPATAPAGHYETASNGTEYFVSGLDYTTGPALGIRATSLAVWALTNTASLNTSTPSVALNYVTIASNLYAQPPNATQEKGSLMLGSLLHDPEEMVATNDDRMNQVVFAAGKLWAAENTAVKTSNGPSLTGIAYFVITPSSASGTLSATMTNQGYVLVNQENVFFPSIGVTDAGKAVMTFSLVGPDYYPSVAYAALDPVNGVGPIHIAATGAGADDGFTGYREFGGDGVARWGDYSAAVADANGTIWFANEYIPNAARTLYANWGTFVGHVTP